MPIHDRKVVSVILEESERIEERFPGYRALLRDLLTDILQAEANHLVQSTRIQKTIKDLIDASARAFVDNQGSSGEL